jgi:hypothetical protein
LIDESDEGDQLVFVRFNGTRFDGDLTGQVELMSLALLVLLPLLLLPLLAVFL